MVIKNGRFSQILLLGNGIVRGENGTGWCELLDSFSERPDEKAEKLLIPMPLRAVYLTNDSIRGRLRDRKGDFFGDLRDPEIRSRLRKLLSLGFDDILTTNYSYELEMAVKGTETLSENTIKEFSKNIIPGKRAETKYLLSTCNFVPNADEIYRIWHIHGEARKPDSMILGHYYYAFLLKRIMEYLDSRADDYRELSKDAELNVKSWLDEFILGDIYILGFGMDFSEFDLWWLLNRKKREKADHGKVWFYTPISKTEEERERYELLKLLDVNVVEVMETTDAESWNSYYCRAISLIADRRRHNKAIRVEI